MEVPKKCRVAKDCSDQDGLKRLGLELILKDGQSLHRRSALRASLQVPPGERGWTRSHLGPRLTCGRGRRGPSGGSPTRRGPPGGRQRGPAVHGRGGGRGWLPAPALPRPGRRGRSVGTARRAHLAGSHPSARRGARWERGPGRRGLSALTGRAAEAPARRRSASRPSRASRASYSGDEERSRHPAQIAAAAGRLHCLTITRAGFSPSRIPRLLLPFSHCGPCLCLFFWNVLGVLTSVTVNVTASNIQFFPPGIYNLVRDTEQKARNNKTCKSKRHVSLEDKSSFLTIKKEDCWSDTCVGNPHQGGLTHLDPRRWLPGRLLSDVQKAGCHCDSARGGSWRPRPARSIAPLATGDALQTFSYK
ncbi:uncharacterized protein AAG666_000045 [Megaptera novaeangliae]